MLSRYLSGKIFPFNLKPEVLFKYVLELITFTCVGCVLSTCSWLINDAVYDGVDLHKGKELKAENLFEILCTKILYISGTIPVNRTPIFKEDKYYLRSHNITTI